MISILSILLVIGGAIVASSVAYLKTGLFKKLYHDVFGWCQPNDSSEWSDGCSFYSICKHCGKEITQDGQGNWF